MSNNATSQTNRKATLSPAVESERLEALLCHLERLLPDAGDERLSFREAIVETAPLCVRVNRLLASHAAAVQPLLEAAGRPVAWCEDAYVLENRPEDAPVGSTLECALGALYVQAKATTLAARVLDPQPGECVLDLAAAPGGKASHIASLMKNRGLLVCNEPKQKRMASLVGNLERMGVHHCVLTGANGAELARWFHNAFDRILLDAPCSGDGIIGKSRGSLVYWSPEDAVRKSHQQIGLLRAAFHMLRPGGTLVYSTCSLSTEENEDVLAGLLHRYGANAQILPVEGIAGLDEDVGPLSPECASAYPDDFRRCIRIWPHRHQTEGCFIARLGKQAETRWNQIEGDLELLPGEFASDADEMAAFVHKRWGFIPEIPHGQQLVAGHRHLTLRPAISEDLSQQLPDFVRAGMRVGGLHKEHLYLSQQSVGLWGEKVVDAERRIELTWSQVQQLFAHNRVELASPADRSSRVGEVICSHGPWQVCRGVLRDGTLTGFIPRGLRHDGIERLLT